MMHGISLSRGCIHIKDEEIKTHRHRVGNVGTTKMFG